MERFIEAKPEVKPDMQQEPINEVKPYIEPRCLRCKEILQAECIRMTVIILNKEYSAYFHGECFKKLELEGLIIVYRELK